MNTELIELLAILQADLDEYHLLANAHLEASWAWGDKMTASRYIGKAEATQDAIVSLHVILKKYGIISNK